jgi:outer membrane protein assembly factor BamB
MDFEFSFDDFSTEMEDFTVKKVRKFDRLWKIGFGGSVNQKPLLHNGVIYFGCCDHNVYAVDAKTAKEIWRFKTGGIIGESSPVLYENALYIGSYDHYVYALTLDGKELWRFKAGDEVLCTPTVYENRIFIGSFDGYLYCLNKKNGRELWRFKTGAEIYNVPPFLIHNNLIYCPSFDNHIYAINIETGREIWRFAIGKYGPACSPVLYKNVLYQETRDGILYALTMDGKEIWRFITKEVIGYPIIYKDRIYVGSGDFYMYCISLEGKEIWRFRTDGYVYWAPAIWNNTVYFTSWDCHLYAVNADTGKELWRFTTSTTLKSTIPSAYEAWEAEIKKSFKGEDESEKGGYKFDAFTEQESFGEHFYTPHTEYKTKSEYK